MEPAAADKEIASKDTPTGGQQLTFVNITHPSQRKSAATKTQVARYIGLHHRNRSKPLARKERPPVDEERLRREPRALRAKRTIAIVPKEVNRDTHGLRSDPFGVYPIELDDAGTAAVDFCTYTTAEDRAGCLETQLTFQSSMLMVRLT
jgi:hypothetical protein